MMKQRISWIYNKIVNNKIGIKSLKASIKTRLSKGSTKFDTRIRSKAVLVLLCLPEVPNYHNTRMTWAGGITFVKTSHSDFHDINQTYQ